MIKFIYKGTFPAVTGQATKKLRATVIKTPGKTFARAMMYTSKKGKDAINAWADILSPHAPETPIDYDCQLTLLFTFPLTSEQQNKRERALRKGKSIEQEYENYLKADTDNLEKMFKDCMAKAGYITNDNLIVASHVVKVRGPEQQVAVILEPANIDAIVNRIHEKF